MLPALDRYDGPTFKVVRKFLREHQDQSTHLDIYILSAEFGLISAAIEIPEYDRKMTIARSQELRPSVITNLQLILTTKTYGELFMCVGQDYLKALCGYDTLTSPNLVTRTSRGGLGKRLSELHDWLYGEPPKLHHQQATHPQKRHPRIRGIDVIMTPEQVMDVARQAITTGQREVTSYQSWYVPVDDQRVAPKWLVSQLTKLPVSTFVTTDARRVLTQLGIEVRRV